MGQPVVHWEMWSPDPERASKFYADVFGWQARAIPDLKYTLVETGGSGGINGGIMTPQQGDWPAKLTLYIDVDEVDSYGAKIVAAGGRMLVPKMEVPGVGFMALFSDPDDRVLGLWQKGKKPD